MKEVLLLFCLGLCFWVPPAKGELSGGAPISVPDSCSGTCGGTYQRYRHVAFPDVMCDVRMLASGCSGEGCACRKLSHECQEGVEQSPSWEYFGEGAWSSKCVATADEADDGYGQLPWSTTVSARESSGSETSAKYLTETSLRREIDRQKTRCDRDKGRLSHSIWQMVCHKSGHTYTCQNNATCNCRPTE